MSHSKDLHLLINSLSKSEKRHFSLASDRRTIYYKLFEIYEQYNELDDPRIEKEINKKKLSSYLNTHKSMLYDRIIASLRDYYRESSTYLKIKHLLIDIEILYERRLFNQCLKAIAKATKLCRQSEEFSLLMHVQNWNRKLKYVLSHEENDSDTMAKFHEDERLILAKQDNYVQHKQFKDRLYLHYLGLGNTRTESENEKLETLAKDVPEDKPNSIFAKREFHSALATKLYAQSRYPECVVEMQNLQDAMEKNPEYIKANPILYGVCLSNYVRTLISIGERDKAFQKLEQVKEIPLKSLIGKVFLFQNYYLVKMTLLCEEGKLREAREVAKYVESSITGIEESLNNRHWFYFRLAYIYFANSELSRSLKFINRILALKDINKYLLGAAHMINLIVHYELQNHELVVHGSSD